MDKKHWTEKLVELGACSEAVEWSKGYGTFAEAWAACDRIDWLTWLIYRKKGHKAVVRLACKYARLALPYTINPIVLKTIKTVEAWLVGKATIKQVQAAARAAGEARAAAAAASEAAGAAVWAAGAAEAAMAARAAAGAAMAAAGAAAGAAVRKQYLAITKKIKITL